MKEGQGGIEKTATSAEELEIRLRRTLPGEFAAVEARPSEFFGLKALRILLTRRSSFRLPIRVITRQGNKKAGYSLLPADVSKPHIGCHCPTRNGDQLSKDTARSRSVRAEKSLRG